jgi:FAD/FMN-containing dehydrogenase
MDISTLKQRCSGAMAQAEDPGFDAMVHGDLWNRAVPERRPELVIKVNNERDVMAVLRFAREHNRKVVVRGGGHNWCQPTLRDGGILIDLANLNQVISIDQEARLAVVQPVVSNRDLQAAVNARGLAFPSGHCPQVKLSGYLLGGGMAWNQGVWGAGTQSIEAIEMVTAAGAWIRASREEHADLFWAARGAGPGFFGVVTRYHLKLQPLPAAILGSTYCFSLAEAGKIGDWISALAPSLSPSVELTLFLLQAPPPLQAAATADGGVVLLLSAVAFADSNDEGKRQLAALDNPVAPPLTREFATPLDFPRLFDLSGSLWPEGHRSRVENRFSSASAGDQIRVAVGFMPTAPSATSLLFFTVFTGPVAEQAPVASAYSMHARVYGGPSTMWLDPAEDAANIAWHEACTSALLPCTRGSYIGESDFIRRPATAAEAYQPHCWSRLAELRRLHDPSGLFFGWQEGVPVEVHQASV